ncbi:MAG: T9SS type A sorting domain-containing protein [Candidatus Cloacimonetes bacterium]|nr:T9SS type A sorting domain-containing protein [Candidatus Cloacimonadota bacterium]
MKNFLLMLLLIPVALGAQAVHYTEVIDIPAVNRNGEFSDHDFIVSEIGAPQVPFESYQFVLPHGARVADVQVELSDFVTVSGRFDIPHYTQPMNTHMTAVPHTPRDAAIYGSDEAFPTADIELVTVQRLAGVDIAIINVYPYKYYPLSGVFGGFCRIELTIDTERDAAVAAAQSEMICSAPHIEQRIERLVRNADMLATYPTQNTSLPSRMVDVDDPYDFVIVCGADYVDMFTEYAAWKEEHDVHAGVFTINEILNTYPGTAQNKLREFVIDAYTTWSGTAHPLQWVLLAGDDEIIPIRGVYGNVNEVDPNIPADMYYGCLDGSWNADGDQYYGEQSDNPDLYAEVHIGRFPGDNAQDFENMIFKTQMYLDYPTAATDNCTLVGSQLDDDPTWGGDYKDDVVANDRLPSYYDVLTLYERDGTYNENNPVALTTVIENDDAGLINHMGHCDYNVAMGYVASSADQLSNTEFPFLYSQGCYAIAWDQQTSGDTECIGEHFMFADGCMFAFVGNSRYGWYTHSSTNGTSQRYDKQYFTGLFDQDIRNMGDCLSYSKEALASYINTGNGTYRWIYYCLNLFGDPQVPIINGEGLMPDLDILSLDVEEGQGDGDGVLNPGEQAELTVCLMCLPGDGPALSVVASVFPLDDNITIVSGEMSLGSLNPGDMYSNTDNPFIIQLADDCPVGQIEVGLEIRANEGTSFYYAKHFYLTIDVELYLAGYPFETGASFKSAPIIVDYDGNGSKELFNVSSEGMLYGLDTAGNALPGFPVDTGVNVRGSLAMGNVDGDDAYEFALCGFNRVLCIVDDDGSILYTGSSYGIFMDTPTMADINGDGVCEVIVGDMNFDLHVVDGSGNPLAGFPVAMPEKILSGVSVGDIDNDGAKEMVFGCFDGNLYAVEANGSVTAGYPVALSGQIHNSTCIFGDGMIAVSSSDNHLYIVNNGSVITDLSLPGSVSKTQIAADFDGDNVYEIGFALTNGAQYIIETDGAILDGWPIALNNSSVASPIAADLDADGTADYIIDDNVGTLHAWSCAGDYLPSFPLVSGLATDGSTMCIDDFTMDATAELAVGTTGGIAVFDIKYVRGWLNVWRTFRGNIWRDGNTATILDAGDDEIPEFTTALRANFPNPFNPVTNIVFSLSAADAQSPVSIKIYNVRGQLVKTLLDGRMPEGEHQIVWRGADNNSRPVGSGVYFTRMTTAGRNTVRKMLLLK